MQIFLLFIYLKIFAVIRYFYCFPFSVFILYTCDFIRMCRLSIHCKIAVCEKAAVFITSTVLRLWHWVDTVTGSGVTQEQHTFDIWSGQASWSGLDQFELGASSQTHICKLTETSFSFKELCHGWNVLLLFFRRRILQKSLPAWWVKEAWSYVRMTNTDESETLSLLVLRDICVFWMWPWIILQRFKVWALLSVARLLRNHPRGQCL